MSDTHLVPNADIRVAAAHVVLREARQQGHDYVEIREAGRRVIFFCTLCLKECYGDSSLWAHLRGSLHARRRISAQRTLFGSLPWPFSDGVLFFNSPDAAVPVDGDSAAMLVTDVLVGQRLSQLPLRKLGVGHVSATSCGKAEPGRKIKHRIWCAWLGEGGPENADVLSIFPDCSVAVVNMSCNCDLGRRNTTEELIMYLEDGKRPNKQPKMVSTEENRANGGGDAVSGVCALQGDSGDISNGSDTLGLVSHEDPSSKLRFMSTKAIRRELRKRERLVTDRICDICRQKMLPGKDVATLLNLNTGKLACSGRNTDGAFHIFHVSCLVHWILLCEFEIWSHNKQAKRRGRGRKGKRVPKGCISTIFCPECQGTGADVQEGHLEHPALHLSEIFLYKLNLIRGHRDWMEDPELLNKCSTGLSLTCDEQLQATPSKLLHFYRADVL